MRAARYKPRVREKGVGPRLCMARTLLPASRVASKVADGQWVTPRSLKMEPLVAEENLPVIKASLYFSSSTL